MNSKWEDTFKSVVLMRQKVDKRRLETKKKLKEQTERLKDKNTAKMDRFKHHNLDIIHQRDQRNSDLLKKH